MRMKDMNKIKIISIISFVFIRVIFSQSIESKLAGIEQSLPHGWLQDSEYSSFFTNNCDFPVVDGTNLNKLSDLPTWMLEKPLLIKNITNSWSAKVKWTKSQLISSYGERKIRSGSESSIVNSGGAADVDHTFAAFLNHTTEYSLLRKVENQRNRSLISDSFLFDTTILQSIPELREDFNIPKLFADWDSFHEENERNMWHMLSLGPSRSGLPFHNHGQTWITVVHGIKHWFVYPIGYSLPAEYYTNPSHAKDFMIVDQWLLNVFPLLQQLPKPPINGQIVYEFDPYHNNHSFGFQPLECTQQAGDTLYLPSLWSHLTINQGETIAIGGQQALYDEERLTKSRDVLNKHLGTFEVYKDIALALFNMATVELEDLRETFQYMEGDVMIFHSNEDVNRFVTSTGNSLVTIGHHRELCNEEDSSATIKQLHHSAIHLKEGLTNQIELDVAIMAPHCEEMETIDEDNANTKVPGNIHVDIAFYPGFSDSELQDYHGTGGIPNFKQDRIIPERITFTTHDELISTIHTKFNANNGGFGSIHSTTLHTKFQYKVALHYYWQAYAIRPYHPETITMMVELAGLCDDFTTMLDLANQSFEFYSPLSDHLTNTSVASMFYNVGRTIVSRGLYEQAFPFLKRSLESMSSFRPALKKMVTVCANLDLKSDALEYLQLLRMASKWEDISEYEQIASKFL